MREIKCRAKRKDNGEWVYGAYLEQYLSTRYGLIDAIFYTDEFTHRIPVLKKTVGEFSGCKDKNKNEIYEGDIVKVFAGTKDENSEEVVWRDGCFCVDGYVPLYVHCDEANDQSEGDIPHCEITGNVYEHPHLINQNTISIAHGEQFD